MAITIFGGELPANSFNPRRRTAVEQALGMSVEQIIELESIRLADIDGSNGPDFERIQ